MFVGGNITEVICDHPELGTVVLKIKASEDNTYDLGGVRGADDQNMVTGSGESIRSLNQVGWRVKLNVAWDMNVGLELQKVKDLAGSTVEGTWTVSHINGSVYRGKGSPVGQLEANVNQATFSLTIGGGGELKKLA